MRASRAGVHIDSAASPLAANRREGFLRVQAQGYIVSVIDISKAHQLGSDVAPAVFEDSYFQRAPLVKPVKWSSISLRLVSDVVETNTSIPLGTFSRYLMISAHRSG